jgi:DNA repair protein RecO (recombination protein O)
MLTREHGRYLAMVHGGRSRKNRPVLQIGNHIDLTWKARLADQLGYATVSLRRGYAAETMNDRVALAGLTAMTTLARLLAERDPHPSLFEVSLFVAGFLDDPSVWPALYVRWEQALLNELGFGLDLTKCAVTGSTRNLAYVSPNSGRSVSVEAAQPYKDRLLRLPSFMLPAPSRNERRGAVTQDDIQAGLQLTGHFIEHRVLAPRDMVMPDIRAQLPSLLNRRGDETA